MGGKIMEIKRQVEERGENKQKIKKQKRGGEAKEKKKKSRKE